MKEFLAIFDKRNILTPFGISTSIILIIAGIALLLYLYFNTDIVVIENLEPMPTPNQLSSQVPDGEDYLYPVYSLNQICGEKGLVPSHNNRLCLKKDGSYQPLSNCKCEDQQGNCEICYPEVNVDRKGRSVVYSADKIE